MKMTLRSSTLSLVIASLLAGCAVMKIDVDVYKGPLANHEHVQTQQIAVMAIGAKPLLGQLRDQLERERYPVFDKNQLADSYKLQNEQAQNVQEILTLYKDRLPDEIARLVVKGRETFRNLTGAFRIVRPKRDIDQEDSRKIWEEIKNGLKLDQDLKSLPLIQLKEAYKCFLLGNTSGCAGEVGMRNQNNIYIAHSKLPASPKKIDTSKLIGANAKFEGLRQGDLVKWHAKLLFRPKAEHQKQRFISRVREIAKAFFDARTATERLLRSALAALSFIYTPGFDPGKNTNVEQLQQIGAKFAVELISLRELNFALKNENVGSDVQGLRKAINSFGGDLNNAEKEKRTREALIAVLSDRGKEKKDGSNVHVLLLAHLAYIRAYKPPKEGQRAGEQRTKIRRRFGIARGPRKRFDADELKALLDNFATGFAKNFERGRLAFGLESLIENYLKTEARHGHEDPRTIRERERLLDALVRFATKVLFVANNSIILEGAQSKLDRYTLVLQAVGNSILVQADELLHREAHGKTLEKAKGRESLAVGLAYSGRPRKVLTDLARALRAKTVLKTSKKGYDDLIKDIQQQEARLLSKLQGTYGQGINFNEILRKIKAAKDNKAAECRERNVVWKLFKAKHQAANVTTTLQADCGATISKSIHAKFQNRLKEIAKKGDLSSPAKAWEELEKEIAELLNQLKVKEANNPNPKDHQVLRVAKNRIKNFGDETFNQKKGKEKIDKVNRREALDQLVKALRELLNKALDDTQTKRKEIASVKKRITDVKKKTDEAKKNKTVADKIRHTLEMVEKYREEVIKIVLEEHLALTGKSTKNVLQSVLKREFKQVSDENKKCIDSKNKTRCEKLRDAIKRVADYPMPIEEPASELTKSKSAKEVLDDVIAALRHEHIKVVSQHGKDSEVAKNIVAALNAAYEHRSGMVYIRPSGAYLRSSYPATSLQSDPGLAWQNMLARHSWRALPLSSVSEWLVNPSKQKREITAEIDKQFWQNINSVRVAGGGFTNYVIAKDDIGNWYVKAYSSDPNDIIKSAQSLALFSMSPQLNTNLLGRLESRQGDQTTPARPDVERSTLGQVFSKHKGRYEAKTKETHTALVEILTTEKIKADIEKAWDNHKDTEEIKEQLKTELTTPSEKLKTVGEELKKIEDVSEQGSKMVTALQAVRRFYNEVTAGIKGRKLTEKAADDLKDREKERDDAIGELNKVKARHSQAIIDRDQAKVVAEAARDKDKDKANETLALEQRKVDTANGEVTKEQGIVDAKEKAVAKASEDHNRSKLSETVALREVTRVVRAVLTDSVKRRQNTVDNYETAIIFIGDATSPGVSTRPSKTGEEGAQEEVPGYLQ